LPVGLATGNNLTLLARTLPICFAKGKILKISPCQIALQFASDLANF